MSNKTRSKSLTVLTAPVCAMLLGLMAQGARAQSSVTLSVPVQAAVGPVAVSLASSQNAMAGPTTQLAGCTIASAGISFGAMSTPALKNKTAASRSAQGSL